MSEKDPFGFSDAAGDVDLAMFEPKPKPVDRKAAAVASEVAQGAGFSRRTAKPKEEPKEAVPAAPAPAAAAPKGARRRIPISQAIGFEDRYPETERAQLNVLAPVPVVLRWRQMVKSFDAPAWALLEKAMDALAAQSAEPRRGRS